MAQDLSNPQYVFYTQLLEAMFQGTPYAHDALGSRPSFDKTTGQMLHQFYDTWYAPNNAIFVIAGDVQPEHVLAEVKALFGDIPKKPLPARPQVNLEAVKGKALALPTDLPYGLAVVSFRMPGSNSPDYAATQLLADVLSSQRGTFVCLGSGREGAVRRFLPIDPAGGKPGLRVGSLPPRRQRGRTGQ